MSLFQVVYKIVPRVIGTGTTDSRQTNEPAYLSLCPMPLFGSLIR